MKESIVRLRALEKQRFAYRYALNVVDFDAETVAPEGSADGRAEACEVLSRADFDLLVNDDTAALGQVYFFYPAETRHIPAGVFIQGV